MPPGRKPATSPDTESGQKTPLQRLFDGDWDVEKEKKDLSQNKARSTPKFEMQDGEGEVFVAAQPGSSELQSGHNRDESTEYIPSFLNVAIPMTDPG